MKAVFKKEKGNIEVNVGILMSITAGAALKKKKKQPPKDNKKCFCNWRNLPFDFDMRRPAASLQVQISRRLMRKKELWKEGGEKKTTHAKKISLPSPQKNL